MRTVIYTRISQDATGEQLGVNRQLKACKELASNLKWAIVGHYDDNDISAFSGKNRPGFEEMLTAMKQGQIDAILCWHTDRLYRSLKDLERLIDIAETHQVQIRTVNGGDLDLSNATGKMLARILGSVARQESEHKGERQRAANAQRRISGGWYNGGQRPFGYTQRGELLEPEATMARKAARDVLAGKSLRGIAIDWNAQGVTTTRGKTWTNLTLRRILMNPLNAGMVTYGDEILPGVVGQWEPLWDVDTHRGLVAFLSDPSRKPALAFERKHLGSGIYVCDECGGKLYAGRPHGQKVTYMCRDYHVARIAAPVDEMVEVTVLAYLAEHAVGADLRQGEDRVDLDALRTQREALTATKGQLATLLRRGILDVPDVERESAILTRQIAAISTQLAEAAQSHPAIALLEDGEDPEVLADVETLTARWAKATPDTLGKIIDALVVVTVKKAVRGQREFDPDLIDIQWR